jgi:uncharacterized protein (DUF2126 family)/transglutaminase-like putative cysteine protease
MSIKVALTHRTRYRYDKAVSLGPQAVQLRPAPHCRTPILSYSLNVNPSDHLLNWQLDPYNNYLARILFSNKTKEFVVEVDLVAELSPFNPFGFFLEPSVIDYPFAYEPGLAKDLEPYLSVEPGGPLLQAFVGSVSGEKRGTISFLVELNQRVRTEINYVTRLDPGVQTCEQTFEKRSGSCRDSAWLLVQILRHLGIAARFVSGYLIQMADETASADGSGPQTDSADFHAWAEAFLPGAGWIGMDPTSGLFAGEGHIPLVCTPNASRAAPIEGTVEKAKVDFDFSISIRRLNDLPRVSKPFAENDWVQVQQVARQIDADLAAQNVRLTMGGEPTFVGIDDPESPQWNIDALGPMKRTLGLILIRCLREKMAPGAVLHFGQGKWYPGEPLPRWALSCAWRLDGVPVWVNIDLIAREDENQGFSTSDALKFMEALTRRLQVSGENLLPAFDADSNDPAGYILPIRRRQAEGQLYWSSQLWFPRPERLLLSPGDSPIGYRIPTESMPWVAPDELKYEYEAAPSADRIKLSSHPVRRMDLFEKTPVADSLSALSGTAETALELIRPSLCVQAREGRLHVFLPYVSKLADYLDLVAAVEDTCQYLHHAVWLEGYPPPTDPRLRTFSVTPDPGVLEVNLPPASNWDELERFNTLLFEEARRNRLTAEKFAYDGSHLATGGGSHIVVGGATVLDSPFLRRPDLLRSVLTFWQNHPSLSYLFSGMYVGPTSQSPRVDEARMDALYELEVAFGNLPPSDCPPHVVDGLFRNLLVDVTGNSHRAEFCIDKLYPPEGRGSRLGLLELRAFEMAPHVRMVLVEMLLIRALVCMFWKRPFENGLVRWGTALHDRFLMPHFVWRDFADVLADLRQSGYPFAEKWFASHFEFRFPKIGSIDIEEAGVELELRHALEPWNVLAEETTSGGTVRVVDSSLERIQVKLSGCMEESRYAVACNGRQVPLCSTGEHGEAVAAVRYRARRLSEVLHPTIPVHTPLVFDIIDRSKKSSTGRCTYHAGPPDGRVYTTRPANATEAEQRRMERFEKSDPTPGPVVGPEESANPMFPMTLDLRLPPAVQETHRAPGYVS